MVKRKLKTTDAQPQGKTPKTSCEETVPNEERKEKLVPFDFDENDCDVIIMTKDKEVHLPSSFLEMASNGETLPIVDGRISIDVSAESLEESLSFYYPKIDDEEFSFSKIICLKGTIFAGTNFCGVLI